MEKHELIPMKSIFDKSLELIEDESHWIKGLYSDRDNTCFCLVGAINEAAARVFMETGGLAEILSKRYAAIVFLAEKITPVRELPKKLPSLLALVTFNDSHTHAKVIELLRSGIADIEKEIKGESSN